jgi:hypothetical protein
MDREFKDALNTYYGLKSQYEKNMAKEKNKIINTPGLSWREKRREFLRIKPKCINCKRPLGTIFKTRNTKEGERHLIALCGDRANPCPLNIDLNVGYIVNIFDFIQNDEKEIDKYKKDIIKEKNDLLFGYIDSEEAVKRFDELKENISALMSSYEYTLEIYLNIVNNKEKKEDLKKKSTAFFLEVDNFKKMISDYEKTQDVQYVSDAIELYINSILPTTTELRNLKYAYSAVEYNEDENTYSLIQKPITQEELEWDLGEKPQGIVSMKMGGMDKFKLKTNAKQESVAAIQPLRKTNAKLALKPTTVVREESSEDEDESEDDNESEEEDESEDEDQEPLPKIRIQPELQKDGKIAASEANRLNLKIIMENGNLVAKNPGTGETYEIAAGI